MSIPGASRAATAADDAVVLSTLAHPAVPAFIGSDPEFWLLQLNIYFTECRITASATKYHHAVSMLPPTVSMERLPANIQTALSIFPENTSLDVMAESADHFMETSSSMTASVFRIKRVSSAVQCIAEAQRQSSTHINHQAIGGKRHLHQQLRLQFGVPELSFLGYHISQHGTKPLHYKVEANTAFPLPQIQKQLRRSLRRVAYYHHFVPRCAALLRPLYALELKEDKSVMSAVFWTTDTTQAFEKVKKASANNTLLSHPHLGAPLSLTVEASDTGVGAVYHLHIYGCAKPLAFYSNSLQPQETRSSTFGCELLASYLAVKHFCCFLEGCDISLYTDHKPLESAVINALGQHSPREQQHLDFFLQFMANIRHVKGEINNVVDALSRVFALSGDNSNASKLDFTLLADAQQCNSNKRQLRTANTGLQLRDTPLRNGKTLLYDTSAN
ncbi:Transposon Tf2-6 polyprotein-like 2 [Homarus americanus]|uniref:Transposon Tf2-6 polyprotein-like 2 n=1 Tax=Homarus americanus TaxID=6706 RepID=A0A8J5JYS5_HOMAM|nr:Transposon Tf2-6 polyprotein-like 2 [Homarus americanus]